MNLNKQYNTMYQGNRTDKLKAISCTDWPTSRFEFAVCHASGGEVLCDVGCGGGDMLYSLKEKYTQLIGFEISDARIEVAKENCKDLNTKFFNNSFDQEINLTVDSVDTIICLDVLDHMVDVRKAINNFYKILKVDGQLILNIPNFARIDQRIKLLLGKFPSTSTKNEGVNKLGNSDLFDGGKLHYFTFYSIMELLKEVGFEKIEKYGIGKYKKIHNIYPELLSGSISLVCTK
jgi:ubiquinone/menaquinone biosynthesis C-methylase UbiE